MIKKELYGLRFQGKAIDYLEKNPDPDLSDEAIREVLSGNLCRCTGYQNIVKAFRNAAESLQAEQRG